MIVKLVSEISCKKYYYEFGSLRVGAGIWVKDEATGGFMISDEESIDPELNVTPTIIFPTYILRDITPDDGKIVNYFIGRNGSGEDISFAWGDGEYRGYLMENGKTIDSL